MARYRERLPQLAGELFLTDGGIETTLIFHEGLELPFSRHSICSSIRSAKRRWANISAATRRSRGNIPSASYWKARPGGRAPIGLQSSAILAMNLSLRTVRPSQCCTTFAKNLTARARRW